jgi:hypothetical protein
MSKKSSCRAFVQLCCPETLGNLIDLENFPHNPAASLKGVYQDVCICFFFIKQLILVTIDIPQVIDGQVGLIRLVRLQTDNFRMYDEQTVNGLRKNARASVFRFRLKRQYIHICI